MLYLSNNALRTFIDPDLTTTKSQNLVGTYYWYVASEFDLIPDICGLDWIGSRKMDLGHRGETPLP